jgi:hypothetical protein
MLVEASVQVLTPASEGKKPNGDSKKSAKAVHGPLPQSLQLLG